MSLKNVIEEAIQLLRRERIEGGPKSSWVQKGGVIRVRKTGKIVVIGDLHGHLEAFKFVGDFIRDQGICNEGIAIFLGDYIDRGADQDEVLRGMLSLKLECPSNIILLRGNHEPPEGFEPHPHDFIYKLMVEYANYNEIYMLARDLFNELPYAAIIEDTALLLHGGPPTQTFIQRDENPLAEGLWPPPLDILIEILWNDPDDHIDYTDYNPRGIGYLWGWRVTELVLDKLGVQRIIRGHEPAEGVKYNHGRRVVTVFTYYGPPYFNEKGAILYCEEMDELISNIEKCIVETA